MLAFHGRIARQPVGRWVDDLVGQSAALGDRQETGDTVVAACGVYNQASLVFFLLGDVPAAEAVLDMEKAFLEARRGWLPRSAYISAHNQIRVNEIRIERATGSPASALAMVRRALDEAADDRWAALKDDDLVLYRSQRADLHVELCKLLVKIGDGASAEECAQIGLADGAGKVLRGVCLESAALLYLRNAEASAFQRLLSRLPPGDPARRTLLLRRVDHDCAQGGRLAAVQLAPKLVAEVRALATKRFEFIDYLHFIDFACGLFRNAGLANFHREGLKCLREGARRSRDIVFFCASSAELARTAGKTAAAPAGRSGRRALSGKAYPIFAGPEARRRIATGPLLEHLSMLQQPQRAYATA
jgi:hypothetical protein